MVGELSATKEALAATQGEVETMRHEFKVLMESLKAAQFSGGEGGGSGAVLVASAAVEARLSAAAAPVAAQSAAAVGAEVGRRAGAAAGRALEAAGVDGATLLGVEDDFLEPLVDDVLANTGAETARAKVIEALFDLRKSAQTFS